jgi:hypothetical protein
MHQVGNCECTKSLFSVLQFADLFLIANQVSETPVLTASCFSIGLHADHFLHFLNGMQEAVNLSLRNLKTYPFVMDRLAKGTLKLIGARYDFVCGTFQTWNA